VSECAIHLPKRYAHISNDEGGVLVKEMCMNESRVCMHAFECLYRCVSARM